MTPLPMSLTVTLSLPWSIFPRSPGGMVRGNTLNTECTIILAGPPEQQHVAAVESHDVVIRILESSLVRAFAR